MSIQHYQTRVNAALERCLLPADTSPEQLHAAMRYAVLNGGKRLRPAFVYATGETLGVNLDTLDFAACAVELIHSYSLIHDDLPAMDNDDLRRGLPTCHKAFDEATAILAGDALQVLAFEQLADADPALLSAEQRIRMISTLSKACGSIGMAGGQALDLAVTGKAANVTLVELETIHRYKTGCLIRASVELGMLSGSLDIFNSLLQYAENLGLAFQIQDDILDIEASTTVLGKQQGGDIAKQKVTYPELAGLAAAKMKVRTLYEHAIANLDNFGQQADPLRTLAEHILHRNF